VTTLPHGSGCGRAYASSQSYAITSVQGTSRDNPTSPNCTKVCTFEQTRLRHFVKLIPSLVGKCQFRALVWVCRRAMEGRSGLISTPIAPPRGRAAHFLEVPMARAYRGPDRKLLCIDDSQAILEYERSLFERSGYIVVTAASARQGLRLATMSSFDAVLLDYHMPEMNGHQVALEIRRIRPQTLVVMFSGSEIPKETHTLVDAVVPKAGAISELLPTVARLCNRSSPA
jgi:CheY-like chemotaxis protein